jgi:hypothetical protein
VLSLLAVRQSGSLLDANPAAVLRLIQRRGWRMPGTALVIALIVVGAAQLEIGAVEEMHRSPAGWFGSAFWWALKLSALLSLYRWLGIRIYHAKKARAKLAS